MKRQIRKNLFETNSSSTHALTLDNLNDYEYCFKNNEIPYNSHITVTGGEYGWGFDILTGSLDKLAYLLTDSDEEQMELVKKAVKKHYNTTFNFEDIGYIDHQSLGDISSAVFKGVSDEEDIERIIKFLAGNSKIIVATDNEDYDEEISGAIGCFRYGTKYIDILEEVK